MQKTIVITSGKGGVGKTSVSVNTAIEIARKGYRTCLFDADFGLANVNILLGIHPEKNLDDFIFNGVSLDDIIIETEFGVDVIPGSSGVEKMANLNSDQLTDIVEGFSSLSGYDFCFIDTSSGISRSVISFCLAASETIIVLTAESTSLADAYALLKVLSLNKYSGSVKILINKCANVEQARKTYRHFKAVADKHLTITIVPGGAVFRDPLVEQAVTNQKPITALFPDSLASQCIRTIANNLLASEADTIADTSKDFWSRYLEFIQSDLNLPDEEKSAQNRQSQSTQEDPNKTKEAKTHIRNNNFSASQTFAHNGLLTPVKLSSPPALLATILKMQQSGQLTFSEMQKIIVYDPAFIGKILQTRNTVLNSQEQGTTSLKTVISELSESNISKILTTSATHSLLERWSFDKYHAINTFWFHCCTCGLIAANLGAELQFPYLEEIYLSGILHDIGRLSLITLSPENYTNYSNISSHDLQLLEREKELSGKTHADLGAEILASWGLSSVIIDAARYHTATEEQICTALDSTKLIYLANQMCTPNKENQVNARQFALNHFDLGESQIRSCVQAARYDLYKLTKDFSIMVSPEKSPLETQSYLNTLHDQALEFVTMQNVLTDQENDNSKDSIVRSIYSGLPLLYGLNRFICLLPDSKQTYLQAFGNPPDFDQNLLKNIRFSLTSTVSRVIDTFHSKKEQLIDSSHCEAMADQQLLRLINSDGFLCLPLTAQGLCHGIIVFALQNNEFRHYEIISKKLHYFTTQIALALTKSRYTTEEQKN